MPDGQTYLEIDDLYVCPEFRAQGIGRRLLDKILREARARSIRKAFIYSSTKDLFRAMRFYESAGFQPWFARMFCEL
jgi:GNAT superfamily N-acetyltransferase